MRVLIITQKVDASDSNLGFFIRWIEEFAKQCEKVTVICLERGDFAFPHNVTVHSLGKENGGKRSRSLYSLRFLKLIIAHRAAYDVVFVHMNPEYIVLGGLVWKLLRKKVILWYVHRSVTPALKLAVRFVDIICTASALSFRIASDKLRIVGHGIDTGLFIHGSEPLPQELKLITVGRITKSKDLLTLIQGYMLIKQKFPHATLTLAGEPVLPDDRTYFADLRTLSDADFTGPVEHERLPGLLNRHTVFLHASRTGSMDKAVLEALAAGLPVFSSSAAFEGVPGVRMFRSEDPADLAGKLVHAFEKGEIVYTTDGKKWVEERHSLERLIPRILAAYQTV